MSGSVTAPVARRILPPRVPDPRSAQRLEQYLIRRERTPRLGVKDAEPTAFSASSEAENLANAIASRYNLRKVRKGKGKGWTPILLLALRRTADEDSFLATVERNHAEEERMWAQRYQDLASKHQSLRIHPDTPPKKPRDSEKKRKRKRR